MKLIKLLFFILLSCIYTPTQILAQEECVIAPPILSNCNNQILHVRLPRTSGIGNRIKKIVSYLRYYSPKHLNLYWDNQSWVTANFFDLFSPHWPVSITEYNNQSMIDNFSYNEPLIEHVSEYSLLVTAKDFSAKCPQRIDTMYNSIPKNLKEIYLPYFENLHPSPLVEKRIKSINLPSNTVSVQIRNAPDWIASGRKNTSLEDFFEIMDSYPPNTYFFISTMSSTISKAFHERYKNRIIELPEKDYNSMIDATADMFILGQTKESIYSFGSTFAEVGWWLGGGKSKVKIVGSDKEWKKRTSHKLKFPPDIRQY